MAGIEITESFKEVNFSASGEAEIIQNVKTIIGTTKYSVPLNREFGIDSSIIDLPLPMAKARLISEVIDSINKYEPRVEVTNIEFADSDLINGIIRPKVKIRIK